MAEIPVELRADAALGALAVGGHRVTVGEVVGTAALRRGALLAGETGLGRRVRGVRLLTRNGGAPLRPHDLVVVESVGVLADLMADATSPAAGLEAMAAADLAGLVVAGATPGLLTWADRMRLPVIGLPGQTPADVLARLPAEILAELLERRSRALADADRVHAGLERVVRAGAGLPDLADELVALLGAAVFVTDADGRVLASSGATQLLSDDRARALFDTGGRCRAARAPVGLHPHSGRPGSYVVVAVPAGPSDMAARVVAVSEDRTFGPADIQALERAASVVALALARRRTAADAESRHQGDVMRDLLQGTLPPERALGASGVFGWDLERPLVVIVSRLDPEAGAALDAEADRARQERFAAAWSAAVRARDPRAAVTGFAHEVVAVVGAAGDPAGLAAAAAAAVEEAGVPAARTPGWGTLSTGLSRVAGVARLAEAYAEAQRAIAIGQEVRGPGGVTDFNALGVYRLLSLLPEGAELRTFVRETLGGLAAGDAEARDLRQTLEILLETNLNVAETARRQHFHYNTLRYRIQKLERMLGPFTTDAHLRLNLTLALQIVRMRGLDDA